MILNVVASAHTHAGARGYAGVCGAARYPPGFEVQLAMLYIVLGGLGSALGSSTTSTITNAIAITTTTITIAITSATNVSASNIISITSISTIAILR